MTIRVYTSEKCGPCEEIRKQVQDEDFQLSLGDNVEVIDIGSDDGFQQFYDDVLSKEDGEVPVAFRDGQKCHVGFDEDDKLVIECPTNDSDAFPEV